MTKKIGFIGTGNMASAIIGGVIKMGVVAPADIIASDASDSQLARIAEKHNIQTTRDNIEVARAADILFLSVKPQVCSTVVAEIRSETKADAIIVSIMAGLTIASILEMFGANIKLVKTMPNTPAMVNCGMTAVCAAENVTEAELDSVLQILNAVGRTIILPEKLFGAYTALAGSSPAYVFMFIEALTDAGVNHGLSRAQSLEIATQAVLGTAKLLQETGENPAALREAVCSPGGTTIAAICELEKQGFRSAIISAATVCADRYNDLN